MYPLHHSQMPVSITGVFLSLRTFKYLIIWGSLPYEKLSRAGDTGEARTPGPFTPQTGPQFCGNVSEFSYKLVGQTGNSAAISLKLKMKRFMNTTVLESLGYWLEIKLNLFYRLHNF